MSQVVYGNWVPMEGKIVDIKQPTPIEKLFTIELPQAMDFQPCQFVMVSIYGLGEAPISICSDPKTKENIQLLVRKVGTLTGKLHEMEVGDKVGIRGPFGNGFPVHILPGKDVLLIGGGCGFAPLQPLVHHVINNRDQFGNFSILYGCRTPSERLFSWDIDKWKKDDKVDFHETVDSGDNKWEGNVGLITTLFKEVDPDPATTIAMIVGPPIMYKFVIRELMKKHFNYQQIYVSLERRMRCGVGKCGHCQINEKYSCQDGPVFCYNDILGQSLKEAL